MASRQVLRSAAVLTIAWLTMGLWPSVAAAEDSVAFRIKDSRIKQSSGLATDTTSKLYWTVNNSGDEGVAYGLTPKGTVKGTLKFRVAPTDVEAVTMAADRLYIGDIGDSDAKRKEVTVFYFDNPKADGSTVTYKSWDLRYADGKHNAETLLVNAAGRVFVVTKAKKGAVYAAPKDPKIVGVNKLTKVGAAPAMVTDGVFLPGYTQIALLTSSSVDVIDAKTYKRVASAKIPAQKQAESLTLSLDGKSLLVGGGGKNSKVYEMAIPAGATPSPKPSEGSDSGDQGDNPDDSGANSGLSRRGTFLALGLAAFVAVVAGGVVALVRRSS